jgi:glycosyltransferase involved in cell wall biosynthesis
MQRWRGMAKRHSAQKPARKIKKVGFVSTRIAGTDGVSLETLKWASVFERMGLSCYYIAGKLDTPKEKSFLIRDAWFGHPVVEKINDRVFGRRKRTLKTTRMIHETAWRIKQRLYECQKKLGLDLVVAENALTIPMNIPLGLALVEFLIETGLPCIAHHHDFYWERERFLVNAATDYLRMAFPPALSRIQHVVINRMAREQLSFRVGLASVVIPNVMNFQKAPTELHAAALDLRAALGLSPDDWLILQPTRIVPRKGIEHAIELVKRLDDKRAKLVISHAAGDEGDEYAHRVLSFAELLGVKLILAENLVGEKRKVLKDGTKQYTLEDFYLNADLVTYPSTYEGFGNAFLEALYYRKPIVCNRYSIYQTDIEPRGFDIITMNGFVTDDVVARTRRVLVDEEYRDRMVEKNFRLASRFFSYRALEKRLSAILTSFHGAEESH